MMSRLLGFALLATAHAGSARCAMDGARSVDSAADAALNLWAASKRCSKKGDAVQCEVDVTAAAQSIGDMANTIVGAAAECGAIDTENSACGRVVGELLATTAGLASRVGGVMDKCPGKYNSGKGKADIHEHDTKLGKCILDAKDSLRSVFKIMQGMTHLQHNEDKDVAAAGVVTDFGAYVAGSVAHCSPSGNKEAACASHVLGMVSELDRLGEIGDRMAHACSAKGSRLYSNQKVNVATASNSLTLALGCFLPITAVLSFIVGLRFAKARNSEQEPRELE